MTRIDQEAILTAFPFILAPAVISRAEGAWR